MMHLCDPTPRWYAIQSKSRQEMRAEGDLAAWGVEVFLPRIRTARYAGIATGPAREPLFPGYLFARFVAAAMLHKIRYTRGVARVLGTKEGPTVVAPEILDVIRSRLGPDGLVEITTTFAPGDRVRVMEGPLRDFLGVFESTTGAPERVRLLLTALNGTVRVVVSPQVVERVRA